MVCGPLFLFAAGPVNGSSACLYNSERSACGIIHAGLSCCIVIDYLHSMDASMTGVASMTMKLSVSRHLSSLRVRLCPKTDSLMKLASNRFIVCDLKRSGAVMSSIHPIYLTVLVWPLKSMSE